MTLLTHTGHPVGRAAHTSEGDQPKAVNTRLAAVRRFCMFILTAMLILSAVGAVITFKTVAYLSHFTH